MAGLAETALHRKWQMARLMASGPMFALAVLCPAIAQAQDSQATPAPASSPVRTVETSAPTSAPKVPSDIVVYGARIQAATLEAFQPEQIYDEDGIASYGATSVGELLDGLTSENGDLDPQILVNGRPSRPGEVADLPVEAVSRVEQMPRGSSSRVGGPAGQRTYNVVLKPRFTSVVAAGSYQVSTDGGWDNKRAESTVTYIRDNDRINLSLRGGWSGDLLQSERPIIPVPLSTPYAPTGNLLPLSGAEIDPALSLLAGQPVSVAGVPIGVTNPSLADFAARAGQINPSELAGYRSLRGPSRPYDASLTANKLLAPWLTAAFTGRLSWTKDSRLNGLPSARFTLPVGHPNSPFSRSVVLAFSDPTRPLVSRSQSQGVNLQLAFTATLGDWRITFSPRYDDRDRSYSYALTGPLAPGSQIIPASTNPFAASPAGLIPIATSETTSRNRTSELKLDGEGPLFNLPTGDVRLRIGAGATWLRLDSVSGNGAQITSLGRHEYELRGGITVPLASAGSGIGPTEISLDGALADLGPYGTTGSYGAGLTWQAAPWLRITARQQSDETAISPELQALPSTIIPNVPYFDPVTGQSVDVTLITGGGGNLANQKRRVRQLSLNASPWKTYNLQLNADFLITDDDNQAGALPLPTPAIVAAFPDRFVRDSSGRLILVDSRTVNFARQHTAELRTAASFMIPLSGPSTPTAAAPRTTGQRATSAKRQPRTMLIVNLAWTHVFVARSTIRDPLGPVDLLAGGAVGLFGSRTRDGFDGSLAINRGGIGVRTNLVWRGPSYLASGTAATPDLLRFDPFFRIDLKLFADTAQLLGPSPLTRGLRITVSVDNLTNRRQAIRNQAGTTPLGYQPYFRDPLGRTVAVELRKVF
jgi:hypothetical protein